MKVNEIFESIQGEGKYIGYPVLFIRVSGCTRACSFCDTKYHTEGVDRSQTYIITKIKQSKCRIVVWTGGEPMLYYDEIETIIKHTKDKHHHLETNSDIMVPEVKSQYEFSYMFNYICFSPKDLHSAMNLKRNRICVSDNDIKVVTDLTLNKELIPYATILMPLSTYDEKKDKKIQQDVWNYCVKNQIKYCPRVHVDVWGNKKGI